MINYDELENLIYNELLDGNIDSKNIVDFLKKVKNLDRKKEET